MMRPSNRFLLIGAAALVGAACADSATGPLSASTLLDAFSTTPVGFENTASSYAGTGAPMAPPGSPEQQQHRDGPGGDFMGGGMHDDFMGGPAGMPPFEIKGGTDSCTFDAASGVVSCSVKRDGLTILRTFVFKNAAGVVQSHRDSTTDSIVEHDDVSGTVLSRRDSSSSIVKHVSDRTVSGASKASTKRTVSGTSSGSEATTGKTHDGVAFTGTRTIADTTTGLVTPVVAGKPSYPTAGTVVRVMNASRTAGGVTKTSARREVVTYDGSATAKLVITENGVTKNCTLPLPHGRPTCS